MSHLVTVQVVDSSGYVLDQVQVNFVNGIPEEGRTFEFRGCTYYVDEVLPPNLKEFPLPTHRIRILEIIDWKQ